MTAKITKSIIKKLNAMTAEQTVAEVLTKEELAQWAQMNKSATKAELRALPINTMPR